MLSLFAPVLLAAAPAAVPQDSPPPAGMLRFPDVSATHVVFGYANDLWLVPRDGGMATPLASPPGLEIFPRFSDDGRWLVFQGNYEGGRDLYVMPSSGGAPRRVTHHPAAETPLGWTPDGRILFMSGGYAEFPKWTRLLTVSPQGGLPEPLPLPYGANGAIRGDGRMLAYTPHSHDGRTWKRYRGGMATDVWTFDLVDHSARRVTGWEGTDSQPMWHGDDLYYLSDAGPEHRLNVWKHDLATMTDAQITHHADYDVKWPAIGPDAIVYQLGADLMLLELASGVARAVPVTVPGDAITVRTQRRDASANIEDWDLSPNAKRAVVSARGDVWTLPAKEGPPRNLTQSNGVAERTPAWSPDGRWIAYFTDASGEYEIAVTQSDGKGETRTLTSGGGPFKTWMGWSPDSKWIVYLDKSGARFLVDAASGETKELDREPFGFFGQGSPPNWSHDSKWLTWSRTKDDAPVTAVFVYELATGVRTQLTSGYFGDANPAFDRKGDWLFYTTGLHYSPTYSAIDTTFIYEDAQVLMALPLRKDVKSPWLPESDEESWKKDEEKEEESEDEPGEDKDEETKDEATPAADDGFSGLWQGTISGPVLPPGGVPLTGDLRLNADGTFSGSFTIPLGSADVVSGSYDKASGRVEAVLRTPEGDSRCVAVVTGAEMKGTVTMEDATELAFTMTRQQPADAASEEDDGEAKPEDKKDVTIDFDGAEARAMMLPVPAGTFAGLAVNDKGHLLFLRISSGGAILMTLDLSADKPEEKSVAAGINGFALTADGAKGLVLRGSSASIQGLTPGATGERVPTEGMSVSVDPRVEWRQMLTEAWRLQRDYFYDPNMHGMDWSAVLRSYLPMVDHCTSREDFSYVLGELIAELNVGHAYVGAAPGESQPSESVGMLGVDWSLEQGAYRIARIHRGAPWDADARGPLGAPGVDVKEGEWVLAVNGRPLDAARDPWAAFLGLAGRTTVLTVSAKPTLDDDAREVAVTPVGNDFDLRFRGWIERNRRFVEEQTGGKVGYVYVTDTGVTGQNDLFRQFYPQIAKEAIIIDERWNGGGQIPTRFIELLNRPATNMWAGRDGKDWQWPPDSHQGPKCMLINGLAGSGGDAFPAYFRQAGLGKLIGMRTWGGLVGISGNPGFVDGGGVTVPTFAYYDLDGTWGIEGHGVEPDVEVLDHPTALARGEDPQLEAAIAQMLDEVKSRPWRMPKRPPYPDRSDMGITEEDK
jgi:tricorn protease